ncbi:DNA polymerase III subunit psi [uncultured Paraglaciecola sp.]|uniref:DNA polymerase III subunit psi n=1 Tax=uncultured Paraglaciecola sp. TaxID=1765024 RepID=UPI00260A1079|nr:DNA polymerase III subunit psi [uncultured Paraglaciecola sp.]
MENKSQFVISDYQQAILHEMGISSWQLVNEQQSAVNTEGLSPKHDGKPSETSSTEDALAKLKQLKVKTQKSESTNSLLVTFSPEDSKEPMFSDVLIALGLDTKQLIYISNEQISQYSDYPLCWSQGENIRFHQSNLTTPPLTALHNSDSKKQLWQQLQTALPL